MGGRPMTGMARPPTAGLRPVTQQGLRAPPSRMGTGSMYILDSILNFNQTFSRLPSSI